MLYLHAQSALSIALFVAAAIAIDDVKVPDTIAADQPFELTFQDPDSGSYRIYLAAALVGTNGPTCYLSNHTKVSSPLTLTIPPDVGPSADYYSIGLHPLTSSSGSTITYSNSFNLTGTNATYSAYENALGGAQFWDPNALPCTAYTCARECAQASYPADLSNATAYNAMKSCILNCPGVSPAAQQTAPVHESTPTITPSSADRASTYTGLQVQLTLAPGVVVTALETGVPGNGGGNSTEGAVIGTGSAQVTLALSGAPATVSSHTLSLVSGGVAVDGSTTAKFSTEILTTTTAATSALTTAAAVPAQTSHGHARFRGGGGEFEACWVGVPVIAGLFAMMA